MYLLALPLLALAGLWVWTDLERLRERRRRYEAELMLEDAQAREGTVL